MTERNPALWLQARTDHTAEQDRALLNMIWKAEGITDASALAVSQRGAGANMSVDVAAGQAVVAGDDSGAQGKYGVWNDATKNLTISASDPTNARYDLVVARVKDAFYSGASNAFSLEIITGTPAGSPAEPSLPNNCLKLASVSVAAGATSITNANITDARVIARPWYTAWGTVGYAAQTSTQTGFTTETDISGVSVTFTPVSGRRYRSTLRVPVADCAAVSTLAGLIYNGATRVGQGNQSIAAGAGTNHTVQAIHTGLSGSTTLKGRFISTGGSATLTATADIPIWLLVEDIGPA